MKHREYSLLNIVVWAVLPLGIIGIIIFMLFSFNNSAKGQENQDINLIKIKKEFIIPEIPAELTVPQERANFLITHYWDNFNFSDTSYIHLPEITEQAFANFIELLPHATKSSSYFSINNMLLKAEKGSQEMYVYFLNHYNKYLYEPNSPLRNEEYYIPVLNYVINSDKTGDTERQRAEFDLALLLKNRVGTIATDFAYTLDSGKTGRLHDVNGQYTLLYFYDPDCSSCEYATHYLKESNVVETLVQNGLLKIVMIYPDKDIDLWKDHQKNLSGSWIKGYDKNRVIIDKQLYDLKATPTLYLLDKDKNVLLKDEEVEQIVEYIGINYPLSIMAQPLAPR